MEIIFGAMAPKLSTQIKGLPTYFDEDSSAIIRLNIKRLLNDTETRNAQKRLIKKIEKLSL